MGADVFKVGKVWHYRFQIGNARIQKSTRQRLRKHAEPVAQKAYADALTRANGGQPVPTLEELIRDWLLIHGPISSRAHVRSVETFARLHLYDMGPMPISTISTTHIELARNEHLRTRKPASANHWLRIIKLIANWAVKREIIGRIPWRVPMLKLQKNPRVILPIDVARAWFDAVDAAARDASIGTAARLMLCLGLRESEAISARWEWIDWQRTTYTPGITKGREAEPLPMADWLVDHLKPMRQREGLIVGRKDGSPHPSGFARKAMRSANVACSTKGITPHRLRGTIATLLSENGVPIQTIQKFLRHKSPMTTMAYLEKNMSTAALAQNEIVKQIGMAWRKNGEDHPANPHGDSLS